MIFEWDEQKNIINIEQHGIDFRDATKVFFDKNRVSYYDNRNLYFEERELTIGKINNEIIIIVVHTDRDEVVRIISARKANKRERSLYHG